MDMQLKNYFEEEKKIHLWKEEKEFLYKRISHSIKKRNLNYNSFQYWFKKISMACIFAVVLWFFQFYWNNISLNLFNPSNIAQAEYIWTVVSWNGSYQIINNKTWTNNSFQSQSAINAWWSLIVEKGGNVSIKTSNNAIANVVWPAKVTFHKIDNQIIVDVSYSNSIQISKEEHLVDSISTDVLVVKTEDKTIIGKDISFNISIEWSGSQQVLKSNIWNILVASNTNKESTFELKQNESIFLESELKLFAKETPNVFSIKDEKNEIRGWSSNYVNENTLNSEAVLINILQSSGITDSWSMLSTIDVLFDNQNTWLSQTGMGDMLLWVTESLESGDLLYEQDALNTLRISESHVSESKNDTTIVLKDENEVNRILDVKPILDWKLLELLDKLYEKYYYTYDKDISKVSDIILSLCIELDLKYEEKNLISTLNKINGKIINTYVITPDIKLVQ